MNCCYIANQHNWLFSAINGKHKTYYVLRVNTGDHIDGELVIVMMITNDDELSGVLVAVLMNLAILQATLGDS